MTADVSGLDVGSYVANAQKAVASKVALPEGDYIEFAGSAQAQSQSRRDLIVHSLMAFAGVILLLSIITKDWRNLVLILVNIPFALVGGVIHISPAPY